ncbi:MAG: dihydrolipoyl dehydrogenase [Gammaproteobacteria bacterium]|nr:dihydrolipoyl dehydrogenase [Gammaproteobacteria bacterium]
MTRLIKVEVPDIGDFQDVEIIEMLVSNGDRVAVEQSLITLESDKATIEIPSPHAGVVKNLRVGLGDKVSIGDSILDLEVVQKKLEPSDYAHVQGPSERPVVTPGADPGMVMHSDELSADVVVLGSGPGGYTAAFRAADLGKSVILIERYDSLGGVCLNVGCIPSKALLHAAQVINEAARFAAHGIVFGPPKIDIPKLLVWKNGIVRRLTGGLKQLAKQRKVRVVQGQGRFSSPNHLLVESAQGQQRVSFDQAIIAAGSKPAELPLFPWDDPRVMDSTAALELKEIPKRLLVVGGGIIGLEMATVYHALGARVTVVELTDGLIPGCDRDLVKPLLKLLRSRYENIYTATEVTAVQAKPQGLEVSFKDKNATRQDTFDRILVATGRVPNGHRIAAENAGVYVNEAGFISVDSQQRSNVSHIFAIGDIVAPPMLAHKASHEGKVAAEVCAGKKSHFDARVIPSVAYTDPEIAWMGMTETEVKAQGLEYEKGVFPWAASGRALSLGRSEGMTKLLFDKDKRLMGAGMVGPNAGELIAEAVLALEMGADPEDIALSVHAHPTLSETISFAAEMVEGTITDLYVPKSMPSP